MIIIKSYLVYRRVKRKVINILKDEIKINIKNVETNI